MSLGPCAAISLTDPFQVKLGLSPEMKIGLASGVTALSWFVHEAASQR